MVNPTVQEEISPNLIPMVDIMFLLLLFFMLSADMGQRELEGVRLPRADSATNDVPTERLTINVSHGLDAACAAYEHQKVCRDERHWKLVIRGHEYSDTASLVLFLERQAAKEPGAQVSERKVMIRADAAAPYGLAQRAMNACAQTGLYKIEVGAA